jgi:DNA-binding NtrC family response regulator
MRKETILILDKEYHTRWVLKTLLENEKYIVIAVDTIERARQNFSEFQVSGLITEYRIGRATTLDTVRELKSRAPEAYVMMLTADELTEKEYEEVIAAGVDDYFVKPFPSSKILVHLSKGLKHRTLLLQKKRQEQELGRLKEKTEFPGGGSPESPAAEEDTDGEEEGTDEETLSVVNQ